MAQFAANRTIGAPADRVFETVAHIESLQRAIHHITNVEFLTEPIPASAPVSEKPG